MYILLYVICMVEYYLFTFILFSFFFGSLAFFCFVLFFICSRIKCLSITQPLFPFNCIYWFLLAFCEPMLVLYYYLFKHKICLFTFSFCFFWFVYCYWYTTATVFDYMHCRIFNWNLPIYYLCVMFLNNRNYGYWMRFYFRYNTLHIHNIYIYSNFILQNPVFPLLCCVLLCFIFFLVFFLFYFYSDLCLIFLFYRDFSLFFA